MNGRHAACGLREGSHPTPRSIGGICFAPVTLMATLWSAPSAVLAQSEPDELEQVIVTATRREENIRDVPISITAFSQAQMDVQGMRSMDDIARLAPGIQFSRGGGFGSDLGNRISIRGVSSVAGQSTTGIYIDDTPIQTGAVIASGNFNDNAYPQLFDIQRVEVLRGPQGTLFGSGSEGGTIRFITPAPSLTEASAYLRSEASRTQYGAPSYEFGVAGGAPIVEGKLGFRASAWNRRDGGYVDAVNYYTGETTRADNNYTDSTSARLALAWSPIEYLTITPSVFFQRIEANGSSAFYLPSDGLTGSLRPGGTPLPVFQQPYGNIGKGRYVDIHQTPQRATQRFTLSALKVEYAFDKMDLLSNTSYYERKQHDQADYSAIHAGNFAGRYFPDPTWDVIGNEDQSNRYFTQELRLQSSELESRFKWQVGAFYSDTTTDGNVWVYNPHLGSMLATGPLGNGCSPAQCVLNRFGQPLLDGVYTFVSETEVAETQKAVFGQVDYQLTDHLIATAGVRYARLTNEFLNASGGASAGVPFPTYKRGEAEATATTPKYMLSYKTDRDGLIYASATKGFRNGGSNAPVTQSSCQASLALLGLREFPRTFDPDSVWSYELGSKFTLARGRLQIEASVFQIDWEDQIRNLRLPTCIISFTTNVGATQSRGFDLSLQWRALDSLVLSLNGSYQAVKAQETITSGSLNVVTKDDYLTGSQPNANAAAQYSFDAWRNPAYFRVDVNYTGKAKQDDSFNPLNASYSPYQLFEDPSFTLTNLRLGGEFGHWDVSLFVNNVFNEQPILGKDRGMLTFAGIPSGLLSAVTLRPRTVGITTSMRF